MPEHYDVIIIGTGAGGGTLAHTLAPSGKRILLLERGDFLPREMDNWSPDAVFVDGKYISADTWYDSAGHAVPAPGPLLRGRGHQALRGRPVPAAARGLRRYPPRGRPVAGLAARLSTTSSPGTPRPSGSTRCTAPGTRTPPRATGRKPYPWPAVSHEARLQEISDALKGKGYHPFSAPVGIMLDEADRGRSACIRCAWCDGYPCLVHAKADAEVIGVRPLLDLPNVTLLVNAEVVKLETDPTGHDRDGRGRRARRQPRGLLGRHRGRLRGGGQQRQDPAAIGQRAPPQRPGQRVGPGGPQLHVPQLQGGGRPGQGDERDRVPKDARDQRLLPGRQRTGTGRSATSR